MTTWVGETCQLLCIDTGDRPRLDCASGSTENPCTSALPMFINIMAPSPDKNNVGFAHMLVYIGGEEKVAAACRLHHVQKARLVDGQLVSVPGGNACLVDVHNHHLNLRALMRNLPGQQAGAV